MIINLILFSLLCSGVLFLITIIPLRWLYISASYKHIKKDRDNKLPLKYWISVVLFIIFIITGPIILKDGANIASTGFLSLMVTPSLENITIYLSAGLTIAFLFTHYSIIMYMKKTKQGYFKIAFLFLLLNAMNIVYFQISFLFETINFGNNLTQLFGDFCVYGPIVLIWLYAIFFYFVRGKLK